MDINMHQLVLEKWFKGYSLASIITTLKDKEPEYTIRLNVFYNALKTYTFSVTSYDMSRVISNTKEFQEVCKSQNIGLIKDMLVIFEQYIRSKGYKGNVEIAEILED